VSETVLLLTPVKDGTRHLDRYFHLLSHLTYPPALLSLGMLEGDSSDDSFAQLERRSDTLRGHFASVGLWQKHFGFRMPPGLPRWEPGLQIPRRKVLARARNHLLFRALNEHDWVLWLDVDVADYPADLLQRLIGTGRDIVHPHCVDRPGGRSFDRNAWCDRGHVHLEDLRGGPDLVRLDSVGGTVLLVRGDIHRDGLVFPAYPYGREHPKMRQPGPWGPQILGEIETEGLALMAADMGHQCWGMPNLEVVHASD
jgi:hypothetical protein